MILYLDTSLDYASDFSLRKNVILDCERISAGGIFLAQTIWRRSTREGIIYISKCRDLIVKYGKGCKGNRSFRKQSYARRLFLDAFDTKETVGG